MSLAGADGTRLGVGVIEQTEDGHFEVFLEIPTDLHTGHWTLLAEADGAPIASTTIEVAGTPIGDEVGGQGPRDEDDPLLVALPSGWRASRPEVDSPAAARPAIVGPSAEQIDFVPFVSLGAAVVALAVLVARTRPRGSSRCRSDPPR